MAGLVFALSQHAVTGHARHDKTEKPVR